MQNLAINLLKGMSRAIMNVLPPTQIWILEERGSTVAGLLLTLGLP